MKNYDLNKVVKAVTHVMPCDSCPYPCKAKLHSSQANCDMRWTEIIRGTRVIYCKDCEEYKEWSNGVYICMRLGSYYGDMKPSDYCSHGVRRKTFETGDG